MYRYGSVEQDFNKECSAWDEKEPSISYVLFIVVDGNLQLCIQKKCQRQAKPVRARLCMSTRGVWGHACPENFRSSEIISHACFGF